MELMSASEDAVTSLVNGGYAPQIAREILAAVAAEARSETERHWAAKIREVGTAKGWSVWASAFMDPDVPFTDTGMPSTETIVAELRRLDRAELLNEVADLWSARSETVTLPRERMDLRNRAAELRAMAAEITGEKDTSGGDQPFEGESTPASVEPYAATDPQNCRLTIVPVVSSHRGPAVEFRGEDLAVGGPVILVWFPIVQAMALDRALHAGAGFEFGDHSDDKLTVEPGDPWTVFTFARPSDAEEEAATVRVVVLTGRLRELRRAIRAAITLAEQPTDYASHAPGEPRTCATSDTTEETP